MRDQKINIGIIGLGGAGRAHARRFRNNSLVGKIVGYDLRDDIAIDQDIQIANSIETLLEQVDAVSICTPDHCHLKDIRTCLRAGKHVLVEKPMVASLDEAIELKSLLAEHPHQKFAVHHQMRHAPAFESVSRLVREGTLGRVFYIEANYWHDMTDRSTLYDDWRAREGQSLIFGHACHPFDLILNIVGSEPTQHSTFLSKIGFDDYKAEYTSATTVMNFDNGTIAKTHVNSCCVYPQYNNLIVLGDKGTFVDGVLFKNGKFTKLTDFYSPGKTSIQLNVVEVKIPRRLLSFLFKSYLGTMNWLASKLMSHPDYGFRHYPMTVYNHDAACQTMIDNFIDSIARNTAVLVGFCDAERVIRICEEAEKDGLRRMQQTNGKPAQRITHAEDNGE